MPVLGLKAITYNHTSSLQRSLLTRSTISAGDTIWYSASCPLPTPSSSGLSFPKQKADLSSRCTSSSEIVHCSCRQTNWRYMDSMKLRISSSKVSAEVLPAARSHQRILPGTAVHWTIAVITDRALLSLFVFTTGRLVAAADLRTDKMGEDKIEKMSSA